jgi:hypothetical protein
MTRDEYIQTEVMGKGYHCAWCNRDLIPVEVTYGEDCAICGAHLFNPNFSTSHAYELQQFVLRADWLDEFVHFAFDATEEGRFPYTKIKYDEKTHYDDFYYTAQFIKWLFSDASRFADLVAEFKGYKPSGGTYETA